MVIGASNPARRSRPGSPRATRAAFPTAIAASNPRAAFPTAIGASHTAEDSEQDDPITAGIATFGQGAQTGARANGERTQRRWSALTQCFPIGSGVTKNDEQAVASEVSLLEQGGTALGLPVGEASPKLADDAAAGKRSPCVRGSEIAGDRHRHFGLPAPGWMGATFEPCEECQLWGIEQAPTRRIGAKVELEAGGCSDTAELSNGHGRDEPAFEEADAGSRGPDGARDHPLRPAAGDPRHAKLATDFGKLPPGEPLGIMDGVRSGRHADSMPGAALRRLTAGLPAPITNGARSAVGATSESPICS
jgi:hypothetical protein